MALSCATIFLESPPNPVLVLTDDALSGLAAKFQPQLLAYRLNNFKLVRNSTFDVVEFAGATRETARAFGMCVPDAPELQAGVVRLLRGQDVAARGARWAGLDSLVVEGLLFLCHETDRENVYVGELCDAVNGILVGRNERLRVKARKVGAILRSLNVVAERDAKGYAFPLLNEVRLRIHELGRALEVPSLRQGVAGCEYCAGVRPGN